MSTTEIFPVVKPEEVGLSSERLGKIPRRMQNYLEHEEIPGAVALIARHGKIAYYENWGMKDTETKAPLAKDDIFRMYSMTKPITAVAILLLYEEGKLLLSDPVSNYIPAFANQSVLSDEPPRDGSVSWPPGWVFTVKATRNVTIRDLLTHTAGLASPRLTPIGRLAQLSQAIRGSLFLPLEDGSAKPLRTIKEAVENLAKVPLSFQPGSSWTYGHEFDVLGYLVEVISGKSLDAFFRERIFTPLGMKDSSFYLSQDKLERFTSCYCWDEDWKIKAYEKPQTSAKVTGPKTTFSGLGDFGGVLSTVGDYARFSQMLLNGGKLGDTRILSRKTVELMSTNHTGELYVYNRGPGWGYGFGVGVLTHLASTRAIGSVGMYAWGGAACTHFFVDPKEDLIGLIFSQVFGWGMKQGFNFRKNFDRDVYQALI